MIDENNQVAEDEIPEIPEIGEDEEDTTDYKALAQKLQGMSKRFQTKLKKLAENPPAKPVEKKPDGLDYGQKAYLGVLGYKDEAEDNKVQEIMKATGKTLEQVLESKYFKSEIDEMREQKKTAEAIPTNKRSASSAKNEVDYWIAKGELPDDVALRRKVVAARREKDSKANPFRM